MWVNGGSNYEKPGQKKVNVNVKGVVSKIGVHYFSERGKICVIN